KRIVALASSDDRTRREVDCITQVPPLRRRRSLKSRQLEAERSTDDAGDVQPRLVPVANRARRREVAVLSLAPDLRDEVLVVRQRLGREGRVDATATDDRCAAEVDRGVRGGLRLRGQRRELLGKDIPASAQATSPQDVSLRNGPEKGLHGREIGADLVSVSLLRHLAIPSSVKAGTGTGLQATKTPPAVTVSPTQDVAS